MTDNPNIAGPKKPRRRWLQFRLRTLLIGMALLAIPCAYVGWQARIVTQRASERRWLEQHGTSFREDGPFLNREPKRRLSRLREFLGDQAIAAIYPADEAQGERAAEAFPESKIVTQFPINDLDY